MKNLLYKDLVTSNITDSEWIVVDDKTYKNNPNDKIMIEVRPEDSEEYLREMVFQRSNLPEQVERSDRDKKSLENCIKAIEKVSDYETLIKKIKTLSKYSGDLDFPYRTVCEIIRNLDFVEDFHYTSGMEINDSVLTKMIISQVLESLEYHSFIHPKIKLLINLIGKLDSVEGEVNENEGDFNLKFTT